jgi:uncharacterized protein YozE (UPF0346 family)
MQSKAVKSNRYYLHGDVSELNPDLYYCGLCDSFELEEHFTLDTFHTTNNQEKYNSSFEIFRNASKNFLKQNLRPSKTINLFSVLTKNKGGRFYRWLIKQNNRKDPIGDLANDAISDNSFPTGTDSLKIIHSHLVVKNSSDVAFIALDEAYYEFKSKNKSRDSIPLKLRFAVFKNDNYKCRICGASAKDEGVKLEVDHKIPIAMGGNDYKSNLWTLCFKCNRGKGKLSL